jgi:hypothetical protein
MQKLMGLGVVWSHEVLRWNRRTAQTPCPGCGDRPLGPFDACVVCHRAHHEFGTYVPPPLRRAPPVPRTVFRPQPSRARPRW